MPMQTHKGAGRPGAGWGLSGRCLSPLVQSGAELPLPRQKTVLTRKASSSDCAWRRTNTAWTDMTEARKITRLIGMEPFLWLIHAARPAGIGCVSMLAQNQKLNRKPARQEQEAGTRRTWEASAPPPATSRRSDSWMGHLTRNSCTGSQCT